MTESVDAGLFLRFRNGEGRYALSLECSGEILDLAASSLTAVCGQPPWVLGLFCWRGRPLWALDLARLGGQKTAGRSDRYRLLLVHDRTRTAALAVEAVDGVEATPGDGRLLEPGRLFALAETGRA